MRHVGTSGWQYDAWRGAFYPHGLSQPGWLRHYAERFATVEVNNSFYRLPERATFERWAAAVPRGFRFAVKASRYITHVRRLRDAAASVDLFWAQAGALGQALGPVLFQLPPNFAAEPARLSAFLATLPSGLRGAFEFRHDSWRTDEVLSALHAAGAAWVLADRPGARVPSIVTGGWAYLRFHQGRLDGPGYAQDKLRRWADRIVELQEGEGAGEVYAYFNNDQEGAAPRDAATLIDLLSKRGLQVATPRG